MRELEAKQAAEAAEEAKQKDAKKPSDCKCGEKPDKGCCGK
ncbi:hypothetical protein ACFLXC_02170 [Chloroflexota bacterium]